MDNYNFDYDYNSSCDDPGDCIFQCDNNDIRALRSNMVYVYSIICVMGILGNALVIVTFIFYKTLKSMTDIYLLNVAIADIMFVLSIPLLVVNEQYGWILGDLSCKLLKGIYSVNLYSGMLLLACISTDRYIAIVQARRSFKLRATALVYSHVICLVVWLVAVGMSLPTFIFYKTFEYQNITVCETSFLDPQSAVLLKTLMPSAQLGIGFFLPLLIMIFTYSSITCTLLRAKNFQRHKAVRVVMAVVVVFIVCHLPYNIILLMYTVNKFRTDLDCDVEQNKTRALIYTECLAYLHCCLNPILYAFIGVTFRNNFLKIFQDLGCLSKKYISGRSTPRFTTEGFTSRKTSEVFDADNAVV
ncbi:C-C chemokine receptor type 6-like [Huso huso]|uniref:C-C chemokine receptor type 6-like n=1 Tax=Huso huso TaxID=61971 RepID=A0ABR0ZVY4_HUSHU